MAVPQKQKRGGGNSHALHQIKCYQVNLRHSRAATASLMQVVSTVEIGMTFIQELYHYQGRLTGITQGYRTFAYGEGKRRAAIIVQDNKIDALLIAQLSMMQYCWR